MPQTFLDFERPIDELASKIEELSHTSTGGGMQIDEEIVKLRRKLRVKTAQIFRALTPLAGVADLAAPTSASYT